MTEPSRDRIDDTIDRLLEHGHAVTIRKVADLLDDAGRIRGKDHHAIWDVLHERADLERVLHDGRHYSWERTGDSAGRADV